jgi:hypothetical protein
LGQIIELVVDVPSILDVADTILLARDTSTFVAVIVTYSAEALIPILEVLRKFVTFKQKIEQERLGQTHHIETTNFRYTHFVIPEVYGEDVQQEIVQLTFTRDEWDDTHNLAQSDAVLCPVSGQHSDRVVGEIFDTTFVGKHIELEQVRFKYSVGFILRQSLLIQLVLIEPEDKSQNDSRVFIVEFDDLIFGFEKAVV